MPASRKRRQRDARIVSLTSGQEGETRLPVTSSKSPTGITPGVDVEAETLYEAAGLGLARLKKDGWFEGLGPRHDADQRADPECSKAISWTTSARASDS